MCFSPTSQKWIFLCQIPNISAHVTLKFIIELDTKHILLAGTIVYEEHQNSGLQLTVAWNNGALNAYNEEDLILIPAEEEKPAFDRTAIAVQILSGMMPQRQVAQIQSNKEEIVAVAIELTDELIKQLSDE